MPKPQLFLLLLPLAGCVAGIQLPPLSAAHPASPQAAEAPLPPVSETLALPSRGGSEKDAEPATKSPPKRRAPAMPADQGRGGGHGAHQ